MDAIAVGSLYALIALGYTMVYGVLSFINFAHGDVVMTGAWISFLLASAFGLVHASEHPSLMAGLLILGLSMIACAVIGFTIERLAYRPLRKAPRLNVLITAIGVSLLIQNVGQLKVVFGTEPQPMPALLPDSILASVAGVPLHLLDVLIVVLTIVLMIGLDRLVFGTKTGLAMRAVAYDEKVAALMGVPVDRIVSMTFIIGSALAAAGGFFFAVKYRNLQQPADMIWVLLGLKAFVAAVVGGIGNIRGAMLGGLLIALLEMFGASYLSPAFRDVYVFTLLIVVLLVRPTGLLGKAVREKV
jgi:branched-chain amino acid transport system permease protein